MTTLTFSDAMRAAVARVGLTPEAIVDVLGSCLEGDAVHLVGSLAAGLGNAESDIDLHVFVDEPAPGVVPMLFFAGRTRLDLVQLEIEAPAAALARLPEESVALLDGRCALGDLPDMTDLKRLSRWATAVPVHDHTPPLFDVGARERAGAALVRLALEVSARAAALAYVSDAAGSPLAAIAWSRAAEAAVEAVVRTRGHVFVGDKWLSAKVRACGVDPAVLGAARRVDSPAAYDEFVTGIGLPLAAPGGLVSVTAAAGPTFTFGPRTFRLVGGQLVPPVELATPSLEDALAAIGGEPLAAAIAAGAVTVTVDGRALDGRLR